MHAMQSINSARSENLNICTFRCLKSIASFLESVLRTTMRWAVSGAFPSGKHTTACSPQIRETSAEDRISPKFVLHWSSETNEFMGLAYRAQGKGY